MNLYHLIWSVFGSEPYVVTNNTRSLIEILEDGYNDYPFDCIVISPGPGNPSNKSDFGICSDILSVLNNSLYSQLPVMGVCLGHQGLIHLCGGYVCHAPKPVHGFTSSLIIKDPLCPILQNLNMDVDNRVMRYHSLHCPIENLPDCIIPTCVSPPDGEGLPEILMGFRHREKNIFGLQFHPESIASRPVGSLLFSNFKINVVDKYKESDAHKSCILNFNSSKCSSPRSISQEKTNFEEGIESNSMQFTISPNSLSSGKHSSNWNFNLKLIRSAPDPFELYCGLLIGTPANENKAHLNRPILLESSAANSPAYSVSQTQYSEFSEERRKRISDAKGNSAWSFICMSSGREEATDVALELTEEGALVLWSCGLTKHAVLEADPHIASRLFFDTLQAIPANLFENKDDKINIIWNDKEDELKAESDDLLRNIPLPDLLAGWVGFVGYEARQGLFPEGSLHVKPRRGESRAFMRFCDQIFAYHHPTKTAISIEFVKRTENENSSLHSWWKTSDEFSLPAYNHIKDFNIHVPIVSEDNMSPVKRRAANFKGSIPESDYLLKVEDCLKNIRNGDTYELCFTNQRIRQPVALHHISLDDKLSSYPHLSNSSLNCSQCVFFENLIRLYELQRIRNPAPYGGLFFNPVFGSRGYKFDQMASNHHSPPLCNSRHDHAAMSLLSASPELFVKVTPDRPILLSALLASSHVSHPSACEPFYLTAVSKPIKGTVKRAPHSTIEDDLLAEQLSKSVKDQAENLMIVDVVRHDFGHVASPGCVSVPVLLGLESHPAVHQMVSTVRADRLKKHIGSRASLHENNAIEVFKSCFPAGSMTGAPKLRSMQILSSLEAQGRGVYSGAFGFFSLGFGGGGLMNTCCFNVVIRSLVWSEMNDSISVGAGGAIVMASNPKDEFDEMMLKARANELVCLNSII